MLKIDRMPYRANKITRFEPVQNGRNYGGEKETTSTYRFAAVAPRGHHAAGQIVTPIVIRCYMGRSRNSSTVYASIWARSPDGSVSLAGSGSASGYGYHKESAAIYDAMQNAGVTFAKAFDGCGDGAVRVAIEVLAKRLGWKKGNLL